MDSVIYLVGLKLTARFEGQLLFPIFGIFMTASLIPKHSSISQIKNEISSGLKAVANRPLHLVVPEGQLKVHTAPYRGSFSNVLSEALRAAGLGSQVMVAQFLKGGVNQGKNGIVRLCGNLEWVRPAISTCLEEKHIQQVKKDGIPEPQEAVLEIWEMCKKRILANDLNQLVLDEVGLAVSLGYLQATDLISTLNQRPNGMDVILTGPAIPTEIMKMADQVTEFRCGF